MLYRRSYLFRLACDPPVRLWSGFGPLVVPANEYDASEQTYDGAGELLGVPALKQLINGAADRLDFSVSGVSDETLRLAIEDRASVRYAPLQIGWIAFDDNWQTVGDPTWEWQGIADLITTESQPIEGGRQRTITLSAAAGDTRRANPVYAFFTDADQRKRSPTDAIFDHVAGISGGKSRRFGAK